MRCHQAVELLEARGETFEAVLNIQGDEPFVHPDQIRQLADMLRNFRRGDADGKMSRGCCAESNANGGLIKTLLDVACTKVQ